MCCAKSLQLCPTLCDPIDLAHQGFSRQEYYSGLPCPPPGDLPDLGIESTFLMSPSLIAVFFIISANICMHTHIYIHTYLWLFLWMHNINSVLQDFSLVPFSYLLLLFMNWKTQYCYVSSTKNCFNAIPVKIPRNKLNQGSGYYTILWEL